MGPRHAALTRWSLAGLLAGFGLGLAGHRSGLPAFAVAADWMSVLGQLWIASLQMITLPLALGLMLSAVSSARTGAIGALGGKALGLYIAALVVFAVVAYTGASLFFQGFQVPAGTMDTLSRSVQVPDALRNLKPGSAGVGLVGLIPTNLVAAAASGAILPLLVFMALFGLAVRRLPDTQRTRLVRTFQAFTEAMLVIVRWLLLVTPLGVFALVYQMVIKTGSSLAGILGTYFVACLLVAMGCLVVMYGAVRLVGGIPLAAFARAALPAQLVAVSTRSSLASLPAQVDGATRHLDLDPSVAQLVFPLGVSLFRLSEVIANSVKLVFLASVYQVALTPTVVVAFFGAVILYNFSGTGTPNSGGGLGFRMFPVYMAAGIPIEGLLLVEAVETIPDIFDTLGNVTGQVGAAAVLSRKAAA